VAGGHQESLLHAEVVAEKMGIDAITRNGVKKFVGLQVERSDRACPDRGDPRQ
jgi:hypothetical protein